jgi:hypothetical protein
MIFSSSWGLYENVLVIHKGNSSLLYQVPPFLSRAIASVLRNFSYCLTGGICSGTELSKRAWRQGVVIRNSYGIRISERTAGAEAAPCSYLPFLEGVNRLGGGGGT